MLKIKLRGNGENMDKLKRAVIKEELVTLTGDFVKAVILSQILYWSERVRDFDKFCLQEQEIYKKEGKEKEINLTYGWIYKSAKELSEETMLGLSESNIRIHLKCLIEKGYISERQNPNCKWDRTKQYKANIYFIQSELNKIGYALEGYPLQIEVSEEENLSIQEISFEDVGAISETETPENELYSENNVKSDSNSKTPSSKIEVRSSVFEDQSAQNERAIPEIITEITTESEAAPTPEIFKRGIVKMNLKEYRHLVNDFGENTAHRYIDNLNDHMLSKGKEDAYKSHYHVILRWLRDDKILPFVKSFSPSGLNSVSELKEKLGL